MGVILEEAHTHKSEIGLIFKVKESIFYVSKYKPPFMEHISRSLNGCILIYQNFSYI